MADAYDFMIDTDDLERRMEGAVGSLKTEFASLRTGRASSSMLDPISVDAYGAQTPINQVGTVNVPEPRMVTINVWDKSLVGKVEKAIRESALGINPQLNGTIIMLPITGFLVAINLAVGVISRSSPQMNLFAVGFPISMIVIFVLLYMWVDALGHSLVELSQTAVEAVTVVLGKMISG